MTSSVRVLPFALAALSVQMFAQSPERVSVLVHLAPGADRAPVRAFAGIHGGSVRYEYTILPNVLNLRNMPVSALAGLRNMRGVLRVNEDRPVRAHLVESTDLVRGLKSQVNGAGFFSGGAGSRICIIDTGIDSNHIMYRDRIDTATGYDFVNLDADPEDDHGHGAHVAGIAAGAEDLLFGGQPLQGVAYRATLIGVKVLDWIGMGLSSDVVAGIQHCANPPLPGGPADVINLSLGHGAFSGPCDDDEVAQAANNAVSAGVVVVASAGNAAQENALSAPACGSNVISVGATWDKNGSGNIFCTNEDCSQYCVDFTVTVDLIACFSNRSDRLDVVAPGCEIHSAAADLWFDLDNGVQVMCGTSQAAPHVAGLTAFMRSEDPSLTPAEIRQRIRAGAIDLGTPGFDSTYGHGRIDVINALGTPDATSHASNLLTGKYVKSGKGKNATVVFEETAAFVRGEGVVLRVTVTDGDNNHIQNATVVFAITGPQAATVNSGPSNGSGVAEGTWQTKAPNKRGIGGTAPGTYTATVTGVTATGYQWDNVQAEVTFTVAASY